MDVIIPALKPTCVTKSVLDGIQRYIKPRRILIITVDDDRCKAFAKMASDLNLDVNLECVIQDTIFPNLTHAHVSDYFRQAHGKQERYDEDFGDKRSGWYFQQFLKMGVSQHLPSLSEHYLVWDSDMVILRPMEVLRDNTRAVVHIGGHILPTYDATYKRLFGVQPASYYEHTQKKSFIAHHMVVYKPYMLELLGNLSLRYSEAAPSGEIQGKFRGNSGNFQGFRKDSWPYHVMDQASAGVGRGSMPVYGFSEYSTYISWTKQHYPESQFILTTQRWRRDPLELINKIIRVLGGPSDGLQVCCPEPWMLWLNWLMGFDYVGFELATHQTLNSRNLKAHCNFYES